MLALDTYRLAEALAYTDAWKFVTPLESRRSCETVIQEGKNTRAQLATPVQANRYYKASWAGPALWPAGVLTANEQRITFKAMQGFWIRNIVKINILWFESCWPSLTDGKQGLHLRAFPLVWPFLSSALLFALHPPRQVRFFKMKCCHPSDANLDLNPN